MNKYIIGIILILGVLSCRKNIDIISTDENEFPTQKYVFASLKGKVVTTRDMPVEGASVVIGEYTQKTDFNGVFYFNNIKANIEGSTVSVYMNGFEDAIKIFYPQLSSTSYIKIIIKPIRKTSIINFDDKDKIVGDEVNKIQISGDEFKKDGDKYKGTIIMNWNYVSSLASPEEQYGDPVGYSKRFKLYGLDSYGSLSINITDELGKSVKLGGNNTIELRLGLTPIISQTEEKLTLWKFDIKKNKWMETGVAILIEENGIQYYYAEVIESGIYNFAKRFPVEKTEIKIEAQNTFLPFTKAFLSTKSSYKLSLSANDKGMIHCFIPSNKKSKIELNLDNESYIFDVEAKQQNTITIEKDYKNLNFTGGFFNCDDEIISNGYVTIFTDKDSLFYFFDENGNVSIPVIIKESENYVQWTATDIDTKLNTGVHRTKLNEVEVFDADEVYICQEPFALMQYGDESYLMELTNNDKDIFSLTFEKGKAFYEINSYPFKGVGEYNINNCNCTPTIKNSKGERLYIYSGLEHRIYIEEYNKNGMIVGGLEAKVRTQFSGTDTTNIKIYYSVYNE